MTILEASRLLRETIGLDLFSGGKYYGCILVAVPIFITFQFFCMILTAFLNFFSNIKADIPKALSSCGPALFYFMLTAIYLHLQVNCADFYSLFDRMQAIANEST